MHELNTFDLLREIWPGLNKMAELPPSVAAPALAKVANPDAVSVLFPELGSGYMSKVLMAEVTPKKEGEEAPKEKEKAHKEEPKLSVEQMRMLMEMVYGLGGRREMPPVGSPIRPAGLSANMVQLGLTNRSTRIPTLGELIYGRR